MKIHSHGLLQSRDNVEKNISGPYRNYQLWGCLFGLLITLFVPRGRGPLKTTNDVISAAKRISEIGTKLNELCQKIAEDVSVYIHLTVHHLPGWWGS